MPKTVDIIQSWTIDPRELLREYRSRPGKRASDIGGDLLCGSPPTLDIKKALAEHLDMALSLVIVGHMLGSVNRRQPLEPFRVGVDNDYRIHIIDHNTEEDN